MSDARGELTPGVAAVLEAAAIPSSKLGAARRARLTESQRQLYIWILRRFAVTGRPSRAELDRAASDRGIELERSLETLAREDLVHVGEDGGIAVAYPFSGCPTAHRVRFPSGHEVYAMCAIDALGVAPMFGEAISVTSEDPVTGERIDVRVEAGGSAEWQPRTAVVVAGAAADDGDACRGCCPILNFFASEASAERWLTERPAVRGDVITVREAADAGRAVFGDVLRAG